MDVTKTAAAAATLVTLLGALAVSGVIDQMQRNHPWWTLAALVLVVLGSLLTLVAQLWFGTASASVRRTMDIFGALLFTAGVIAGLIGVVKTHGDSAQPSVTATFDPQALTLAATIHSDGLTKDGQLRIAVDGLVTADNGLYKGTNLYRAFVGPKSDGTVDHPITVSIPPGRYTAVGVRAWTSTRNPPCEEDHLLTFGADRSGCAIVTLPNAEPRPELAVAWGKVAADGTKSLHVHIAVHNVSLRLVGLAIRGVTSNHRSKMLAVELLTPNPGGAVDESFDLPVSDSVKRVCVKARLIGGASKRKLPWVECPLHRVVPDMSAAELRAVPSASPAGG
jgi:hypothetical protein